MTRSENLRRLWLALGALAAVVVLVAALKLALDP